MNRKSTRGKSVPLDTECRLRLGHLAIPCIAILLLTSASPASAHGEEIVVILFGGAAMAQLIEGLIIGVVALRKLRRAGVLVIAAFIAGVWAIWWYTFRANGLLDALEALGERWELTYENEDWVIMPIYWSIMLLAGPVSAAIAWLLAKKSSRGWN